MDGYNAAKLIVFDTFLVKQKRISVDEAFTYTVHVVSVITQMLVLGENVWLLHTVRVLSTIMSMIIAFSWARKRKNDLSDLYKPLKK